MLSQLLRRFLFTLVHLVVRILVAGRNVYHRFWVNKCGFSRNMVTKSHINRILKEVPRMRKKLQHLVVLADAKHSMSDLACLVIWSLVAGIPYVSFHDISGKLKEKEEKFFLEVERKKKGIPGCIKWSNKPVLNGYTNGIKTNTVNVHMLTADDGRPAIVQCIQQIVEDKISYKKQSSEFTAQEFDEILTSVSRGLPDPDLVLYSGSLCCTYGLLPWQIRLAEFVQLSLHYGVNIDSYLGALNKYNKCDQRFGK